jgi:hypothetical protein
MTGTLAARPLAPRPASPRDAVGAEWLKFRTTRATAVTALLSVVFGGGYGVLFGNASAKEYASMTAAEQAGFDPGGATFQTLMLTQLLLAVAGALAITTEYRTGGVVTSMTVVPLRGRLLAAKTVVVGLVGLVLGEITAFTAFLSGQSVLAGHGLPHLTLGQPGMLGRMAGAGLYLALIAILGLGVGFLVRASAGAVVALVAGIAVIPAMAGVYPAWLGALVTTYWPTTAGTQIFAFTPRPEFLAAGPGFALFCVFVTLMMAAAHATFRTRDA